MGFPEKMAGAFKFGQGPFDPENRFVTSWLLSPWALFFARAGISFYAFFTTFFIIGWEASGHDGLSIHDVNKSFSFFTILGYWGIAFYFLISALHTFTYASSGRSLLSRLPRPLQALHSLFYSTITTFPLLVTIIYWGILFSYFRTTFAVWSNTSQHALNSVFALFEILFTRVDPVPFIHIVFLVILLALYCGLAYITYATKHYFVYSFLNFHEPNNIIEASGKKKNLGGNGAKGVVIVVVGMAVAIVVLFLVNKGLGTLRKWGTERKLGMQGKFADAGDEGMDGIEIEMGTRPLFFDKSQVGGDEDEVK